MASGIFDSPAAIVAEYIARQEASEAARRELQAATARNDHWEHIQLLRETLHASRMSFGEAVGWMLALLMENGNIFDPRFGAFYLSKVRGPNPLIRRTPNIKGIQSCSTPREAVNLTGRNAPLKTLDHINERKSS